MSTREFPSDDLFSQLGNRLLHVMDQCKLKQGPFAESIGISQGYLSDIIRGRKEPSKTVLIAIEGKHGYRLDWLLVGEGPMKVDNDEKKTRFNFRSLEKKAFDKNHQKFHDALDYIFSQGSTPQRREIMGTLMDLERELQGGN